MQSHSPQIIKHYIPYQFSKEVLDSQCIPREMSPKKQGNPLQNIKLRRINQKVQKELVLTYTNKTNSLYKSKKSLKFEHLLQRITEEHKKINIIKEHILKNEKDTSNKEQGFVRISNVSCNELENLVNFDQTLQLTNKNQTNEYYSTRNLRSEQTKKRRNIGSRRFTLQNNHVITGRLHSTANLRQTNKVQFIRHQTTVQFPLSEATRIANLKLKIKGKKAPQRQVVDHLKRTATSSTDYVIHINRGDKR